MIKLRISCGCGSPIPNVDAAVEHANETGHQLTLAGSIVADGDIALIKSYNKTKDAVVRTRLRDILAEEVKEFGNSGPFESNRPPRRP